MLVDQTFEECPGDADERSIALAQAAARPRAVAGGETPAGGDTRAKARGGGGLEIQGIGRLPADSGKGARAAHTPGTGRGDLRPAQDAIPVLEPLAGLLPQGLRRGEAVAVASRDRSPDYLTLALLAGALAAGFWCAAVGVADLGGVALAELLGGPGDAALDRLLLVPEPGGQWAEVTAALADGVDLLLIRPPEAVPADVSRRVDARLRQGRASGTRHSAAMLVLGTWASARLVLRTAQTVWTGLDGTGPSAGTGHLTGGRATIVAEGRAAAGRPRTVRLWLPAADGAARSLIDVQAPAQRTAPSPAPPRPPLTAVA